MQNLFDDVPTLTAPDNLFSDVPELPPQAPEPNLFEDVPLDPSSPAGQQEALKRKEQEPTLGKRALGAALGVREGFENLKSSAAGLLRSPVMRGSLEQGVDIWNYLTGGEQNAVAQMREKAATKLSDSANTELNALDEAATELSPRMGVKIPRMLGQGVVSTFPSLAVAPFSGIKGASLAAGLQSFGSTYDTAYRTYAEKMSPEEAKKKALLPAIASGLVTAGAVRAFGGLEGLFASLGAGALSKEGIKGVLKEVLKSAGEEIPEEALDQFGQGIIEQKSYNPEKTWEEIVKDSLVAGALGGGVGLLLGGVAAPVGALANRRGRAQRLEQLRGIRERRGPPVIDQAQEREVRQAMLDHVKATVGEEGVKDAQPEPTTAVPVDVPLAMPVPEEAGFVGRPFYASGEERIFGEKVGIGTEERPDPVLDPETGQYLYPTTEAVPAPTTAQEAIPPSEPAPTVQTPPNPPTAQGQAIPEATTKPTRDTVGDIFTEFAREEKLDWGIQKFEKKLLQRFPNARLTVVFKPSGYEELFFTGTHDVSSQRFWRVTIGAESFLLPKITNAGRFESVDGFQVTDGTTPGALKGLVPAVLSGSDVRLEVAQGGQIGTGEATQPTPPVLEPPAPSPITQPAQPPPAPPRPPTAPPIAPPATGKVKQGRVNRRASLDNPWVVASPTPAAPVDELTDLVQRREAIKAKLLSNPTEPLPLVEQEELTRISDRIHQLDPNRGGPTQSPVEDEPVPTAPEVAPQPTVTSVQTAPAAPIVTSRYQAVLDAAEVKLQALLAKLGLAAQPVQVHASVASSGIATVKGAIATVTEDGRIVIFKDAMDKALARFRTNADRRRFVDIVLAHEAFHAFVDKTLTQAEVEAVWASLTSEQQVELMGSYAPGMNAAELETYQLGHEYLRRFLERKAFGTTTESVRPDSTFLDRWTEALRAVVAKVLGALKITGVTGNATFDAATRKLEKALGQPTAGKTAKTGTAQRPAALVTDPSRRHDELVASSEIPQQQVAFVNQSVYTQNQATVGHAFNSFQGLAVEVQGFLASIRTRFAAMFDARAALGGQVTQGDLSTMVGAITTDPKEQALLYADAWQNVAEILSDRAQQSADIEKKKNELEAASKRGGTQGNPTQALISAAAWHEINNLIVQRNAVIAAQGQPGGLNQRIDDLKQWMHETVFYRVATAIAAGQPLNYRVIGVDPVKGAIAAQVLQNYPGLAAGIQTIQTTPQTNPDVLALQSEIQQRESALAWTDQLIASPEFRTNYEQSRKAVGAELKMVSETEAEVKFADPITGETVSVVFSAETGVIGDGQNKLVDWLKNANAYLLLPADQRDPLTEAGVRNTIKVVEEVYLNPSYTPEASGKIYVGTDTGRKFDPFNALTLGGNISTQEARLERIGGLEAAIAQMRGQAYGMVGQQLRTKYERMRNAAYIAVKKAVKSHRKDSRPITSDKQWIEEISNPIFASWQEQGSRHLNAGMKHLGRTINATDMAAIEAQKKLTDAMARLPSNVQTTMTRLFPLKIKEDGLITYFREPQATGLYTMPRYTTGQATVYAQEWLKIAENKDADARRRAFEAYLGGKGNTQAFIDLVIGHMRSATDVPTYARFISSPFNEQYRSLARDYHEGNSTAPNSVTDVLDRIFQGQTVAPEKLMAREGIADTFFAELTKAFNAFAPAKLVENPQNAPRSDVKVTSADNFLTTPRGEQILPSGLYEYSVADRNQHSRAMNAILEVLGQRFVESLQATARTLQVQIKKFNDRVNELQRQGVESSKANDQVQAESRQAHLDGLNWFDYNESIYQLEQINKSIEEMRQIAANDRALENRELRTGTHIFRSFFGGPLLETIGVVWRNFVGGPLKLIQRDWMMSKSIRIFRNAFDGGVSIPGGNLIASPLKRLGTVVKTVATGGVLPSFLANKFFDGAKGQAVRAQLAANPQAFDAFSRVVYQWANDQAKRYDQLRDLGLAGSGGVVEQIQAYLMMFSSGGQIRSEGGSIGGAVQSVLGIVSETGLPGGHPGLPRNAFSRFADLSVNNVVGGELTQALTRLEEDARLYLSRRRGLGHTSTMRLTPEELIGNKFATQKEATYLRNQWQKAGLNIDRKMLEYFDKVQAAKNAGQPFDQIRLLDDAERNSLFMVYANEINKGSFMNRPAWLSTTELGRNFGVFKGYGLWDNSRFRYALSRFSKSKDKTNAEGVSTVLLWLFAAIPLAAVLGESINKLLAMWLYNEERQTPNPFKAESPWEAAKAMATWMAPFQPMVGGVFNTLFTGVSKDGKVSMDFIPTSAIASVLNTARAINQTGDPVRPVTAFVRQWFPNTRIVLNRLPYNDGLTEYYNANRSLRANTPGDIEVRQATGGSYRYSSTSDNVQNVLNALNRPNGPDWELVDRERQLGIAEKAKGSTDARVIEQATRAFDASVKAKSPVSAVYGRRLQPNELSRIEARMSEPQRARFNRVTEGFDAYAERTGRGTTRRSTRRGSTRGRSRLTGRRLGRIGTRGRIRSTGRLRRTGRLRGLRSRSLRSSLR